MAFNPLALLLGQQAATQTGASDPNEILVTANKQGPDVDVEGPDAPFMGNRGYLEEAAASLEGAPQRSGMFGTKGTLRDILGVVGDAFLTQAGRNTVYAPQRQREKMADAMTGFTNSEESALAAIERMTQAGFGDQAAKLHEAMQQSKLRQAQTESLNTGRQNQAADRDWGNFKDARALASRMMQAAGGDPEKVAYAMQEINNIATRLKIDPEDLGVFEGMTDEQRAVLAGSDLTVNQAMNLPIRQQNADTSRMNAKTSQSRAATQASRPNRSITPTEYLQGLISKPEEQRTPEEKAYIEKQTTRSSRNTGRRSIPNSNKLDEARLGRFKRID